MLKEKLRELRLSNNMTQEAVAERLGVSSQTVSKWERGLLSPDIATLPKIATLFHCTIDSLFDFDVKWSFEHISNFHTRLEALKEKKDWEGVYDAWVKEIEKSPEDFHNYPAVMCWALDKELYSPERMVDMRNLAIRAEKYCKEPDILNTINWFMIQLCIKANSEDLAKEYYKKLPSIRHGREVFAIHTLEGEKYRAELVKTVLFSIDAIDSALRHMIIPDMSADEKFYFYKKSVEVFETVFDNKYTGITDLPLLNNYHAIIVLLAEDNRMSEAKEYLDKMLRLMEGHLSGQGRKEGSKLLNQVGIGFSPYAAQKVKELLDLMKNEAVLADFREEISELEKRYNNEI